MTTSWISRYAGVYERLSFFSKDLVRQAMVTSRSWDIFLTRTINGLAGETSWLDWSSLRLWEPDTLWVPVVLLGSYWLWKWRRKVGRRLGED